MGEGMKIVALKIEGNGTFAKDVPAIAEAVKASGADLVLMPGNSRVKRSAPAAAFRAGAEIDITVTLDEKPSEDEVDAALEEYRKQQQQQQEQQQQQQTPQGGSYYYQFPFGFDFFS